MGTKNKHIIEPGTDNRLVADILQIINDGRDRAYATVNIAMVETYWNVGRRIVQEEQNGELRAEYGTQLLKGLSASLTKELGKGFTERNLRNFRSFYLQFPDYEIWHACVPNLSWTHFRSLLSVENKEARYWYMNEAASENWSSRTLDRNIGSQYYFRLLQSQHKEPVIREMQQKTADYQKDKHEFIKNPVVAEFLGLSSNIDFTESDLESSILTHLQKFLLELGKGYAFVARQQHISTDVGDFYIDLVFYNYLLKAFLLIDLKTTKITHQDVGQMDMYVRMYDDLKRTEGDNPTIGLILCSETSKDIANTPSSTRTLSSSPQNTSPTSRQKKTSGVKSRLRKKSSKYSRARRNKTNSLIPHLPNNTSRSENFPLYHTSFRHVGSNCRFSERNRRSRNNFNI